MPRCRAADAGSGSDDDYHGAAGHNGLYGTKLKLKCTQIHLAKPRARQLSRKPQGRKSVASRLNLGRASAIRNWANLATSLPTPAPHDVRDDGSLFCQLLFRAALVLYRR